MIDANNLAGKLNLLKEKDFDRKLTELMCQYVSLANKKIVLVFDGAGAMSRRGGDYRIEVLYARDHGYESADEKIIETMRHKKDAFNYIVVSDDRHIIDAIEKLNLDSGKKIDVMSAKELANKVLITIYKQKEKEREEKEVNNKEGLSDKEIQNINDELLGIWRRD